MSVLVSTGLILHYLQQCYTSYVFIVKFEHISHLALVFLLLTLNM